jgi:hypothetical protein
MRVKGKTGEKGEGENERRREEEAEAGEKA